LVDQIDNIPRDSLLITATTKSGIDNLEKMKRGIPADGNDIVPALLSRHIAQKLGLSLGSFNVSAACASSNVAIAQGAALISSGLVESAVIISADMITEFVFSGFSALQVLSPFPCKPFDKDRAGLSLGEGASFLTLMSAKRANRIGLSKKGAVAGFGMANDAVHITAPDRQGTGLIKAITRAMKVAGIEKDDVAGISAHGTGTIHNDLMELTAFHSVFSEDCPPIYSVKGCLGHAFGAAGGIEVALGNKALLEQTVPPTVGFSNPEAGAKGLVSSQPASITGDYLLVTNSGFGGINAAIIIKR
jgi:3-oxoacyl-[acyl-carrier-protein] synthase II